MAEKIGSIYYDLDLKDSQFNSKLKQADQKTKSYGDTVNAVAGAFVTLGAVSALALKKSTDFLLGSVQASSKYETSMTSITRIGQSLGYSMDEIKSSARSLTKDGLLTVTEAAGGLNNLLRSGFNLKESVELMKNFKNTAAFGKQSALSFGQAIVSATEGVKNGNSILVDNAGVTKNLSRILQEAGYAETDLMKVKEDAGVRQALYNGLLGEGAVNLGDAAAYANTYAGKQTILNTKIFEAKAALGDVFKPMLASVLDKMLKVVEAIQHWIEKNPTLVKIIAIAAFALMGFGVAIGIVAGAVILFNVVGATALGIIAGISLVIGIVILAIGLFVGAIILLYKKNEWFRDFVDQTWQKIKEVITTVWRDHLKPALERLKAAWDTLVHSLQELMKKHPELAGQLKTLAKLFGGLILFSLLGFLNGIVLVVESMTLAMHGLAIIVGVVSDALERLKKTLDFLPDSVKAKLGIGKEKVAGSFVNTADRFGETQVPQARSQKGARAAGGYQQRKELGLVGEEGPELFVPDTPGHIIDAQRTAAMLSNGVLLGSPSGFSQQGNAGGYESVAVSLAVNVDGVTAMTRTQANDFGSFLIEAVNDDLRRRGLDVLGEGKIRSSN